MDQIAASDARRHLPRLLDRVTRGESHTITRHGSPVARLAPVTGDRDHAKKEAARIHERRQHFKRVPLADLVAAIRDTTATIKPEEEREAD